MNKLMHFKNSKGFTVIEVLLTIAILGIVMAAGAAALIQFFEIIPLSNERMSTRQLAEIDLNRLVTLVREAKSITPSKDEPIIKINEDGTDIEIDFNDNKNTIEKNDNSFINNVKNFDIEEADADADQDNLYIITFEKCNTEDCNKSVSLKTRAFIRNISN